MPYKVWDLSLGAGPEAQDARIPRIRPRILTLNDFMLIPS
jgi:hypothetical protein